VLLLSLFVVLVGLTLFEARYGQLSASQRPSFCLASVSTHPESFAIMKTKYSLLAFESHSKYGLGI
jgi:hypothetical protein